MRKSSLFTFCGSNFEISGNADPFSFPRPYSANPGMSTRNYVLNSSFPPKPLADESLTLQDAGLLNSVVIQKFQ